MTMTTTTKADVVVHHRLEGSDGLSDLIATAEKLLEPFPRRPAHVFTPWFASPSSRSHPPPIKPAKDAPVIRAAESNLNLGGRGVSGPLAKPPPTPENRSWNVLACRGACGSGSRSEAGPSSSKGFRGAVSAHGLHPRQRSKWIITQHNCGAARDIQQVWRTLNRAARAGGLPTCNATIRRERSEIWVFCDVLYSETVGRFLKERLRLTGSIALSVHKHGKVFSLG
ncbi:shieldin complex subunit 3 [Stigmatopora argus]